MAQGNERKKRVRELIQALNERDPALRAKLLAKSAASNISFERPGIRPRRGREELAQMIDRDVKHHARWFSLRGTIAAHDDSAYFEWAVKHDAEPEAKERVEVEFAEDGRVAHVSAAPAGPSAATRLIELAKAHPVPAAALGVSVLYALLRVPLMLFYGHFGTTPEEVGFGNVNLVRESVFVLALMIGVFLLYVILGWLFWLPTRRVMALSKRCKLHERRKEAALLSAAAAIPIFAFAVNGVVAAAPPIVIGVFWVVLLLWFGLLTRLVIRLPRLRAMLLSVDEANRRSDHGKLARLLGRLIVAIVLVGLLVYVPASAFVNADEVHDGGVAEGTLFPWRALPVHLSWTGKAPKPEFVNDCRTLRYLGEADGHVVVFDSYDEKTYRLPDTGMDIRIDRDCAP